MASLVRASRPGQRQARGRRSAGSIPARAAASASSGSPARAGLLPGTPSRSGFALRAAGVVAGGPRAAPSPIAQSHRAYCRAAL